MLGPYRAVFGLFVSMKINREREREREREKLPTTRAKRKEEMIRSIGFAEQLMEVGQWSAAEKVDRCV